MIRGRDESNQDKNIVSDTLIKFRSVSLIGYNFFTWEDLLYVHRRDIIRILPASVKWGRTKQALYTTSIIHCASVKFKPKGRAYYDIYREDVEVTFELEVNIKSLHTVLHILHCFTAYHLLLCESANNYWSNSIILANAIFFSGKRMFIAVKLCQLSTSNVTRPHFKQA